MSPLLLALLAACVTEGIFVETEPTLERMVAQDKLDPYEPGSLRHPPAGTVPFGAAPSEAPPPVDLALLERGRDRFERFCAPCHGLVGDGDGPVAPNLALVKPADLHAARLRDAPDQQIYRVIREGYGLMPAYGPALPPADTWAVVAYVRALQLSQEAPLEALPPAWRAEGLRRLPRQP